jgi:hypothetical protein
MSDKARRVKIVAGILVSAFHEEDPTDPLFDTLAKRIVATLDRRADLDRRFDDATEAAKRHATYRRP